MSETPGIGTRILTDKAFRANFDDLDVRLAPDMKALADYIHSKGLKIGIYSSPGPQTCAKYEGSYRHESQEAGRYAAWGIE